MTVSWRLSWSSVATPAGWRPPPRPAGWTRPRDRRRSSRAAARATRPAASPTSSAATSATSTTSSSARRSELRDKHRIDVRIRHEVMGIDLDRAAGRGARPRATTAPSRSASTSCSSAPAPVRSGRTSRASTADSCAACRPSRTAPSSSTTPSGAAAATCRRRRRRLHRARDGRGLRHAGREVDARRGGRPRDAHPRPRHGARWSPTRSRELGVDVRLGARDRVVRRPGGARPTAARRPPTSSCSASASSPNTDSPAAAGIELGARGRDPGRPPPADERRGRVGRRRLRRVVPPRQPAAAAHRARHRRQPQGRVAGINIGGGYATFPGVVGTAITKVCATEVGRTGLTETRGGRRRVRVRVGHDRRAPTRAGYFPGRSRSR